MQLNVDFFKTPSGLLKSVQMVKPFISKKNHVFFKFNFNKNEF